MAKRQGQLIDDRKSEWVTDSETGETHAALEVVAEGTAAELYKRLAKLGAKEAGHHSIVGLDHTELPNSPPGKGT